MAVALIRTWVASARGEPDRPAVLEVEQNRWFTRGEILDAAMRAAQWLDRSVPEEATVLLHGPGGAGYWAGLVAVLGSGRRLLPLGMDATEADRHSLVESHGVAAILETDSKARWCSPPADVPVSSIDFETVVGDGESDPLDRGARGSLLLRSSGTTGRPGVVLREGEAIDRVSKTLVEVLGLVEGEPLGLLEGEMLGLALGNHDGLALGLTVGDKVSQLV